MIVKIRRGSHVIPLEEYVALQREIFQSESKIADSQYAAVDGYLDIYYRAKQAGGPKSHIDWAYDGVERMLKQRSKTLAIIIDLEKCINIVIANCRRRGVPDTALAGLISLGADIGEFFSLSR